MKEKQKGFIGMFLIVFVLLLTVLVISYYYSKNKNVIHVVRTPDVVIPESATSTIPSESKGDFVLNGYYRSIRRTVGEKTKDCPSLVVISGNTKIINRYKEMIVEGGNGVNSLDENGNLVVAIDFKGLSGEIVSKIMDARTPENPIRLKVQEVNDPGTGAPVCYSFFKVISAEINTR